MHQLVEDREIRHFHLFCGLGGGAKGFNRGRAQVSNMRAKFRCIGGVDVSPAAIRDFGKLSGVSGTVLDLFDRQQYIDVHGTEPPTDWREATPQDIQAAAGNERPHIVFLSAPCQGNSGLLSETKSKSKKYQALNQLGLRGVFLMLEAWADDPPELILFENVPRIVTRSAKLIEQIERLLIHYGYAVARADHDCVEIGGLAQHRSRFLLVARHQAKVLTFLYEPPKRPMRSVGDILSKFPMPGDPLGGSMHSLPNLQWKTWLRLAFVEAGKDWRSLNNLNVVDGKLADYVLVRERWYGDVLGVRDWDSTTGTVTGGAHATRGAFNVADPRFFGSGEYSQYGVNAWDEASGAITSQRAPGQGKFSVADPRLHGVRHNNVYRIVNWDASSPAVTGGGHPTSGGICVADPRAAGGFGGKGKYVVTPFDSPGNAVIAQSTTGHGSFAVADPRLKMNRQKGDNYLTSGHYGVVGWDDPTGAVSAAACHDNGRWNVADPRMDQLPEPNEKLEIFIQAMDSTWHRPFSTLELAALQSLVEPEDIFDLDGKSDSAKRERIGNAVPPGAAQAIADLMGETLLRAWSGETFALSAMPIWVQPVAVALSVDNYRGNEE
jgi:site-specific DNA-cytosine methylase